MSPEGGGVNFMSGSVVTGQHIVMMEIIPRAGTELKDGQTQRQYVIVGQKYHNMSVSGVL